MVMLTYSNRTKRLFTLNNVASVVTKDGAWEGSFGAFRSAFDASQAVPAGRTEVAAESCCLVVAV